MQPTPDLEIARGLPHDGCSLADAERYTAWLATHHYENFTVVSWLLPRALKQHFYNVYAYCRWADDLGDEVSDHARALALLDDWENELTACYAGNATHPVLIALAPTIKAFDIPSEPFRDLLTAFRQDQHAPRYETWDGVIDYCCYSANPVGRLVLYLCGYRDEARQQLSDATCTALQLANFWQDVSRDLEKGRIYIPRDLLRTHGLDFDDIVAKRFDARYVALMKDLLARTRALFAEGWPLVATVDARLRVDLELFGSGGMAVLDAIESSGYNTLAHRPSIGKAARARLLGRALTGQLTAAFSSSERPSDPPRGGGGVAARASSSASAPASVAPSQAKTPTPITRSSPATQTAPPRVAAPSASSPAKPANSPSEAVQASYAECRRVAREAASNFYYAFFMLPRPKRDALCALYAFMRLVDDVSDAPGSVAEQKLAATRASLARWRVLLDQAVSGNVSAHPILPAFSDTIRRYQIPPRYFHDLISGAEMDLTETRYTTFERLREYCYRVAGTVGLTCLHVFGFEDAHSPELAEQLGIAFQLTNIIRDVGDDLKMGRVYLPADDLARFGCTLDDLANGKVTPAVRELLRAEAQRAWQFYAQGVSLLRHVDRDSRAALWALIRIYSTLLSRIEERDFDVFSSRVSLSTAEKARILLRARVGWWSEADVLEERDRDGRRTGRAFLGRRAG
jgi:squalene synthase HpnC/squalene synthase HpnD